MALPQLPDPIERRNLLWGDPKRAVDHATLAERYLAHGRKSDALGFIDKIADAAKRDALRARVQTDAVELGDFFLLNRIEVTSGARLDDGVWRQALAAAKTQGKTRHALKIAKRLGDPAEIAPLEAIVNPAPAPMPGLPADLPPELLAAMAQAQELASRLGAPAPGEPAKDGDAPT